MVIDQITYQVLQSRLSGIVQEMQDNIFRTGYSTIIRESQDASCMILSAVGDVVGENVVLPLHVSALPDVVRADIRGQVGTARLGEQRLVALADRYGVDAVTDTFAEAEDRTEERVRQTIATW